MINENNKRIMVILKSYSKKKYKYYITDYIHFVIQKSKRLKNYNNNNNKLINK